MARGGAPSRDKRGRRKAGGHFWSDKAERRFFARLAACGNVRASAEATGFSVGTVYALRGKREDFAEKWLAATAAHRSHGKGSIVRRSRHGVQRVRCLTQWSEEVEETFLDALAATCNVTLACEEAGVGPTSVYRRRRLDSTFAEKWQAALEQGYAALEAGLIAAATASVTGVPARAPGPVRRMSPETALKVLQAHRAAVRGIGRRPGWQAPMRDVQHHRDSILRKIAAIKAARRAGPADGADGNSGGAEEDDRGSAAA